MPRRVKVVRRMLLVVVATLLLSSLFVIPKQVKAFTPHDPIVIDGNANFTFANGVVGGSGTPGDPYIIEGWLIEPVMDHAIIVSNTDAYFIIRNVNLTIDPLDCYYSNTLLTGINLYNVTNGRIEVTTIQSCQGINIVKSNDNIITANRIEIVIDFFGLNPHLNPAGIAISESYNITITDNYIQDSARDYFWRMSEIAISMSHNNKIMNNTLLHNYSTGILIKESNDNEIIGNNISSFGDPKEPGINIKSSKRNLLNNNKLTHNGIYISGPTLEYWDSNIIDISNTHNGNPIYYWSNVTGGTVPSNAGQVILSYSNGVIIENTVIEYAYVAILIVNSSYGTIINNTLSNNMDGIYLRYSNNITTTYNTIEKVGRGIRVWYSENVVVSNNTVYTLWNFDRQWGHGIHVFRSNIIWINFNLVSRSGEGVYLQNSNDLEVVCNSIEHNGEGIRLGVDNNVLTYHNNFIDSGRNHYSDSSTIAFWDNGYPSGGNYWWDYNGTDNYSGLGQNISGSDGIGDTPYIEGNLHDRYPLMYPANCTQPNTPPFASFTVIPPIGNTSTIFEVNASSSWDYEDPTSLLEVRWDWEDDGLWDTNWSRVKTAYHQYTIPGGYTIRLEVRDIGGLSNQTTRHVNVTSVPFPITGCRPVNPLPPLHPIKGIFKGLQPSIGIEKVEDPPPNIIVKLISVDRSII